MFFHFLKTQGKGSLLKYHNFCLISFDVHCNFCRIKNLIWVTHLFRLSQVVYLSSNFHWRLTCRRSYQNGLRIIFKYKTPVTLIAGIAKILKQHLKFYTLVDIRNNIKFDIMMPG